MKLNDGELRPCDLCGGPLGGQGSPVCGAKVTVSRLVVNVARLRQRAAMAMHFGADIGSPIATVFSDDSVVDAPAELSTTFFACERCLIEKSLPLLAMCEIAGEKEEAEAEAG